MRHNSAPGPDVVSQLLGLELPTKSLGSIFPSGFLGGCMKDRKYGVRNRCSIA